MSRCHVFKIDADLEPIVEKGLYMKHMLGRHVSVSVVKFVEPKGSNLPARSHSHGEEATLQLRGSCSVYHGEDSDPETCPEYPLSAGQAMIIAANERHFGTNFFDEGGVSLRLNVVTPPRPEFVSGGGKSFYPLKDREGS